MTVEAKERECVSEYFRSSIYYSEFKIMKMKMVVCGGSELLEMMRIEEVVMGFDA